MGDEYQGCNERRPSTSNVSGRGFPTDDDITPIEGYNNNRMGKKKRYYQDDEHLPCSQARKYCIDSQYFFTDDEEDDESISQVSKIETTNDNRKTADDVSEVSSHTSRSSPQNFCTRMMSAGGRAGESDESSQAEQNVHEMNSRREIIREHREQPALTSLQEGDLSATAN